MDDFIGGKNVSDNDCMERGMLQHNRRALSEE